MPFRADNLIKNSITKGLIIYVIMYLMYVCMYLDLFDKLVVQFYT